MSARSAQRTRWRRWRMGWDYIAGRKVRRKTTGHKSSIGADVTVADVLRLLLFPPFALRRVEVLPTLLFPILSVSTACIGFRDSDRQLRSTSQATSDWDFGPRTGSSSRTNHYPDY